MRFVEFHDYGTVEEIMVDNVGSIEFPSPGTVRINYVTWHHDAEGQEYRLRISIRWDRRVWEKFCALWVQLRDAGQSIGLNGDPACTGMH